jgi:hypothetical protein
LTELWLNAQDRNAVTRAANAIERRLRVNPQSAGESRADDLRVMFLPPLAVLFRVKPDDMLVEIIHAWDTDEP